MSPIDVGALPPEGPVGRDRYTRRPVVLIGVQQPWNLGVGYLAAVLRQHRYPILLVGFERDPAEIERIARDADPILIGFSLIFQYYADRFGTLARSLRGHGIACHFTMGGHFPSLSYRDTLDRIPELDSVVRFEGELTLLELADRLSTGRDWHDVQGIAFRRDGEAVANPPRPLIADLDALPYPERSYEPDRVLGQPIISLVASRGCARSCSFCSIHAFYRSAPGKAVRTRAPARVVDEMRALHEDRGITIFLFLDDDFPLYGPVWRRWAHAFIDEVHRQRLAGRAIWKISCRVDSVEPTLFEALREAGLYLVYLGLESGTDAGLATLHKGLTADQSLHAVATLKRLGLPVTFGFMLFDPSSTFDSVRANVRFLRTICDDGRSAAVFCRMLPYDGTAIKSALASSGRLRGDILNPDYAFLDPRVDGLCAALSSLVHATDWVDGDHALQMELNWAWNEVAVMERLFPPLAGMDRYQDELARITRSGNDLLFQVVEQFADLYEDGGPHAIRPPRRVASPARAATDRDAEVTGPLDLDRLEEDLQSRCERIAQRLLRTRNAFVLEHQPVMLEALGRRGEDRVPA